MNSIYNRIVEAKKNGEKLLSVLLDPDKLSLAEVEYSIKKINKNNIDYFFNKLFCNSFFNGTSTNKYIINIIFVYFLDAIFNFS